MLVQEFIKLMKSPLMNAEVIRYSTLYSKRPENLKSHTYDVVFISDVIAQELEERSPNDSIDYKRLLRSALYHDFDEFRSGDITRPLKYFDTDTKKSLDNASRKLADSAVNKLSIEYIAEYYTHAKEGKEGWIIKIADLLSVYVKCFEEVVMLNNLYFLSVCDNCAYYMNELRDATKTQDYFNDSEKEFLMDLLQMTVFELKNIVNNNMTSDMKSVIDILSVDNQ